MNASDKPAFSGLLTSALAFYGQTVTPFALSVWWQACERFDLEIVAKALTAHALDPDRGHFPPKPADLVRQLEGTRADRSLIAWGKVQDAIQHVGAYRSVVFDDPAIHSAITDMGGWITVARCATDELPFVSKRFMDAHRAYSNRPDATYPPRLIGEYEAINRAAGQRVAPPMLIGDPAKARAVLEGGTAGPKTTISIAHAIPHIQRIGQAA